MRRTGTLIVIPCSRRKRQNEKAGLTWSPRESVVEGLSPEGADRLFNCRRQLAERFRYPEGADLGGRGPAPARLMSAHMRYDGNVYRKIEKSVWTGLAGSERVMVVIVSALYGLVAPWEAIRDYKLSMSDRIAPRVRLARWWSERGLGSLLVEYVKRSGASVVHDFLSGAYAKVASELESLRGGVKVQGHTYSNLGSGADHHRGRDVRGLLVRT